MTDRPTGYVDGRITVVQAERFRLETSIGHALVFTLAHDAPVNLADLEAFHGGDLWVVVRYSGEPSRDSALAHDVFTVGCRLAAAGTATGAGAGLTRMAVNRGSLASAAARRVEPGA